MKTFSRKPFLNNYIKFVLQKKNHERIDGPHLNYYDEKANPNRAYLRIIPRTELKQIGNLGNGAFGVVFSVSAFLGIFLTQK